MKTSIIAITSFLASLGAAVPLDKRHLVTVTATQEVWETVDVVATVYVGADGVVHKPDPTTTASPAPTPEPDSEADKGAIFYAKSEVSPSPTPVQPAPVADSPAPPPSPSPPSPTPSPPPPKVETPPPSSQAPSNDGSSGGSAPSGDSRKGKLTYYDVHKGDYGSCGDNSVEGESENIVALSAAISPKSHCGKKITVKYNGKTTTAKVYDTCPSCGANDIDLSRAAFLAIDSDMEAHGTVQAEWWFN
ncbi:MAG: hypothetical protein M1833_006116 [Piccolia ochrophora]|nr:MAG: hypothetical protein M1833_006116 [Piccolia ochrophora]